jgi:hypothetical protein
MARHHHGRHACDPRRLAPSRRSGRNAKHLAPRRGHAPSRAALALACAVTLTGVHAARPSATADHVTSHFAPTADAYVSQARPGTNFGAATRLLTGGGPGIKRSYLRFEVANLSGTVLRATLRLYSKDGSASGYEVRAVGDDAWREWTITYKTAPPPGPLVAVTGRVAARAFTSVDITALVSDAEDVDLAVTDSGGSGLQFASRESGDLAPQLVVETATTSKTQVPRTPQAPATMALASTTTSPAPTTTTGPSTTTSTTTNSTSMNSTSTTLPTGGWVNVINDRFDSGGVPRHWSLYDDAYDENCATPAHVSVSGGFMHMLMRYETTGTCGASWYTAGMMLSKTYATIDQRVTVRFRVVDGGVTGHHIIPMRFPATASWPQGGEEDYCEGSKRTGCSTFLHYGDTATTQIWQHHTFDLTQWHTVRFQRLNHVVKAYIDDLTTPVWTYRGTAATLPDTTKRVVLQQECRDSGCPDGTTGTEDIQIDWMTVDNPA